LFNSSLFTYLSSFILTKLFYSFTLLLLPFVAVFAQKNAQDSLKSAEQQVAQKTPASSMPPAPVLARPMQWLTLAEADKCVHDSLNTRKVYVFFYADWCAVCHEMEEKTFQNQELVDYLTKNFWCVKFNTELQDTVQFSGKKYGAARQNGWDCNGFAKAYLGEKLAFPSNLLLDERGNKMATLAGYQTYFQLMTLVTYFNEGFYKTIDLETYGTNYKMPSWNGKGGRSGTVRRLPK
jgi:thioredoxin-related protein